MNVVTDTSVATDSQAMTEVALGLAMAFFAMMILAMMSMSVPNAKVKESVDIVINSNAQTDGRALNDSENKKTSEQVIDDNIIIFYQGQYLDVSLQPVNLETLNTKLDTSKRYILALSPDLSLSEALIARSQISSPNLAITELDEAWMKRLAL